MAEMRTDDATLQAEASNFERIASDLTKEIRTVESTGGELQSLWQGQASTAANAALGRFQTAGEKQIQELTEILTNIRQAAGQYSASDQEAQQSLSSKMNF
jgi:WXG100 family type VII secretion target